MRKPKDNFNKHLLEVIEHARQNKHSTFRLLKSYQELKILKVLKDNNTVSYHGMTMLSKRLYKEYIKQLKQGNEDLELLMQSRNCMDIAKFYEDELSILTEIEDEFNLYTLNGHIFDVYTGRERSEEDMFDHRTLYIDVGDDLDD